MRGRLAQVLCALLAVCLAAQTWLVFESVRAHRVVPIVLPYRPGDVLAPPPPPPPPGSGPSPRPAAAPGPVMTADDVVRGLLVLSEESPSGLRLTEAQRRQLLPLVREAAERKERLHRLRQREEALQRALALKGVRILERLTPAQREWLFSNRDETERLLRDLPGLKSRIDGSGPAGGGNRPPGG